MKGSVNTTGVENRQTTYTLVPKGEYVTEIIDYEDRYTKNIRK